ncbi:MAG: hypothetical protein IJJ29_08300, partial [Solobacterium sp.]|nr:hypothetical protein [Solobacterium sp.]
MKLFLAGSMVLGMAACSKNETAAESTGNTAQSAAMEKEKEYQWDIRGDMKMHWGTGDDYLQYIKIADEACPIAEIDERPVVSMKAIFPSWGGWPLNGSADKKIKPWHFDASAELGKEAEENGEYLTVWSTLDIPVTDDRSAESVIKDHLSYYLVGERTEDANEGTLVTTGLRTKEINGHTIMYVRM